MANFQSSATDTRLDEAAGLVQVETTKPVHGLQHQPRDIGSGDPDAVRLAVSEALEQANSSLEAVARYAKREPLKALAAAVLIGVVLGRLM